MTRQEFELLITQSPEVRAGTFRVAKVRSHPKPGEKYGPDNIHEVYVGDCSNADALFGWGVIRKLLKKGDAMLILSPDDETPSAIKRLCGGGV